MASTLGQKLRGTLKQAVGLRTICGDQMLT